MWKWEVWKWWRCVEEREVEVGGVFVVEVLREFGWRNGCVERIRGIRDAFRKRDVRWDTMEILAKVRLRKAVVQVCKMHGKV